MQIVFVQSNSKQPNYQMALSLLTCPNEIIETVDKKEATMLCQQTSY